MSEEFELISVPKELLENLVRRILSEYISFSTPEPTQDEEPVAWMLRIKDGKSYRLKSFTHIERRDVEIGLEKAKGFAEIETVPLYLHPAQRPEFVRLSEEEVNEILSLAHTPYEAICATENMLVRKNTINKSDPDSIDLQSKCRGDKL